MSYDIPPPLQHKEKIVFGLTFQQLAYAAPTFLIVSFIIFKTKLSIAVSGSISVIIILTATFFMFFDGKNKVKNWYNYIRNPKVEVMSSKLKEIIDIKKIDDKTVFLSKSKLSIIEIIPMNFMLKTEDEKQAIIIGFQKFLNSLDFPIQIHIASTKIYLDKHYNYTRNKVNQKIKENLTVSFEEMPIDEARSRGAIGLFDDQYGERVRVYQIGDKKRGIFSLEFCGGPHVSHTGELHGVFKIKKEEAISAGVRRIKAVLE